MPYALIELHRDEPIDYGVDCSAVQFAPYIVLCEMETKATTAFLARQSENDIVDDVIHMRVGARAASRRKSVINASDIHEPTCFIIHCNERQRKKESHINVRAMRLSFYVPPDCASKLICHSEATGVIEKVIFLLFLLYINC